VWRKLQTLKAPKSPFTGLNAPKKESGVVWPVLTCRLTEGFAADYGLVGRIRHFTLLECAGELRQIK
jgi:hypothetical protein